ncbi:hypothetical protein PIROE2DRAFT_9633 [Piromyces sp. E2]|nr:hypothetical protein PIROE2DRAFT_9633 [Piromyces sp. E2]|eukprot:OUM63771.1 hypothetical protein PIROE2DRAFT_9633 [Piromyces sp. E2]
MKDIRSELLYLLFKIPVETKDGIEITDNSRLLSIEQYINSYISNTKLDEYYTKKFIDKLQNILDDYNKIRSKYNIKLNTFIDNKEEEYKIQNKNNNLLLYHHLKDNKKYNNKIKGEFDNILEKGKPNNNDHKNNMSKKNIKGVEENKNVELINASDDMITIRKEEINNNTYD